MATISSTTESDDFFATPAQPAAAAVPGARRRVLVGALAGGAAALVASGVMLWAGRAWDSAILAQLISDRMTAIIPLEIFRRVLDELESNAKPFTLAGLTVLQVLVGALIGAGYAFVARRGVHGRVPGAAALTVGGWLALSLVAAPLGDIGVFARDAVGGAGRTQATFLLAALVFGVLTALFVPFPSPVASAEPAALDPGRRRLLGGAALAALTLPALASAVYVGRFVQDLRQKNARVGASSVQPSSNPPSSSNSSTTQPQGGTDFAFPNMPMPLTPTDEFYVVSKNFVDPTVDSSDWELEVSGLVDRELRLSYTDVTTRPSGDFISTLECISNTVGGKYISNARWTGYPLRALLDEAGLKEGVVDIELHAADGYVESIPLAEALADDTMLVHTINGGPLPDEHGYPLRLIVPGIFGMKNVKWITAIVAVDEDIQGYWQERGWSDIATVVTMSRIDAPKRASKLPVGQPLRIGGVAFAGDRGISAVELSLDGGRTWQPAELQDALSPLAWRLWQYEFTPTTTGKLALKVRATDGTGTPQIEAERESLPDGATGLHSSWIEIVG